jgi:3'(2'), 5'-bisphosphate nucleotidase
MIMQDFVITALSVHLPNVMRWAGSVARLLRQHNISLPGKGSGSASTDALTLADLSLQELIVSALRDTDPIFRYCRIDAEETTGDLGKFAREADLTIGIDPIDGTRKYRDHAGDGYSVMLHLRSKQRVLYSLVFIPEKGEHGWWVEVTGSQVKSGPDDPSRPAVDVLRSLQLVDRPSPSKTIYINGFLRRNADVAARIAQLGLTALLPEQLPGCVYELLATGELSGALVHSPNVYDFPVTSHLTQAYGGTALFVADKRPFDFRDIWLDERAHMLRVRGIVACNSNSEDLQALCELASTWNSDRYHDGESL